MNAAMNMGSTSSNYRFQDYASMMLYGGFLKMIERRLLSHCCLITLLIPTFAWALNEPENAPISPAEPAMAVPAKSAPVPSPVKPVPVQTAPIQPDPAQASSVSPAAVQAVPAQPASVKPAPILAVPVKPTLPAPVKPAPLQAVPAKPVPVQSAPAKPIPAKPVPAKPAPARSVAATSAPYSATSISATDNVPQTIDIEVFIRENCLQCDKAKEFLTKLQSLQPQLKIATRDVRKEPAALELLKRMAQNQGGAELDYPAFVVGGQLIIGFTEEASTTQLILDTLSIGNPTDAQSCTTGKEPSCGLIPPAPIPKPESIFFNVFGYSVPLLQVSLPLFTLAMGILDGLNHGSTWVLILIISLLTPMKNRSLIFAIAGTFIAVQGIIYFILMAVWFNIFVKIESSLISQSIIAIIALLTGAVYLKNYLQFGQKISISLHEISKPGIYTRIRKIAQAQNLVVALLGTIVLAIVVQLGELTYKSVFPALYTQVLAMQHLDKPSNYAYLFLYDAAYMFDDIVVMVIAITTLTQQRSQEKEGRALKLVSGLVLTGVGIYLLHILFY